MWNKLISLKNLKFMEKFQQKKRCLLLLLVNQKFQQLKVNQFFKQSVKQHIPTNYSSSSFHLCANPLFNVFILMFPLMLCVSHCFFATYILCIIMPFKKCNIFEVPAVTKKTVPPKKIPVAVPTEEAPPAKGTLPLN